ncbi:galactose-specific lectin nattectin [Kryptolebias marmoratus]|uniref:Galactose-specific lectin nattectin-like n=1 Tax=Kryptolebias marmoratus TaxID=37003 RepID=A0A3Q3B0Z1_KRYMA|nr:galactose-specific lectin nattectin [Kryptolebias marmoratus]
MTSSLLFVLLLCGLGIGANAGCNSDLVSCKSCPPGWTWYGGYCYVFDASKRDWHDSERFCNSFDGNLASLETQSEYEFIRDLIYRTAGRHEAVWVGGYDAVKEGYWFWSDGLKFTFNAWGKNEPNNLGGNENCMMINLNGKDYVNDAKCDAKLGLVCAKDP